MDVYEGRGKPLYRPFRVSNILKLRERKVSGSARRARSHVGISQKPLLRPEMGTDVFKPASCEFISKAASLWYQ